MHTLESILRHQRDHPDFGASRAELRKYDNFTYWDWLDLTDRLADELVEEVSEKFKEIFGQ